MKLRVGIPRALFYYYYFPWWKAFLEALGAEVVVSPETNKAVLNDGVKLAVDEACLPVKVFYGHVLALIGQVDVLFLPRLVSVEHKAYICPKLMGLPDMLRASIKDLPRIIDVTVDLSKKPEKLPELVLEVGRFFTGKKKEIMAAWHEATRAQEYAEGLIRQGHMVDNVWSFLAGEAEGLTVDTGAKRFKVALVGHAYNLYDRYISMNIIDRLSRLGASVVTPDFLPDEVINTEAARLPKRMFWSLGKRIIGSTLHFLQQSDINGLIHVASFGCGPDSLVGDLVERYSHRSGKIPFLYITIDEQTGEAGIQTRIEAFTDMLAWKGAS